MCDPRPPIAQGYLKKADSNPGIRSTNQQVRQPVTVPAQGIHPSHLDHSPAASLLVVRRPGSIQAPW